MRRRDECRNSDLGLAKDFEARGPVVRGAIEKLRNAIMDQEKAKIACADVLKYIARRKNAHDVGQLCGLQKGIFCRIYFVCCEMTCARFKPQKRQKAVVKYLVE